MKYPIICALLTLSTISSFGLTIPAGPPVTLGTVNVSEDIIIEAGGTLVITGNLTMGHPITTDLYMIKVEDGGTLKSTGGSISGVLTGSGFRRWLGIVIEPTSAQTPSTNYAVDVRNFAIRDAIHGIAQIEDELGQIGTPIVPISRKVRASNTIFARNSLHNLVAGMTINIDGTDYSSHTHNLHAGVNSWTFDNCQFYAQDEQFSYLNGPGPQQFFAMKGLTFYACEFFGTLENNGILNEPQTLVLFSKSHDVLISACKMHEVSYAHVMMHGLVNRRIMILNNEFNYSDQEGGVTALSTTWLDDLTIRSNRFLGDPSSASLDYGIATSAGPRTYWADFTIEKNTFEDVDVAIAIKNDVSEHQLYLVDDPNHVQVGAVSENEIYNSANGLIFSGVHLGTSVECNLLDQGSLGLIIGNTPSSALADWTNGDHMNQFINMTGLDIFNETLTTFSVDINGSVNPNLPLNNGGPVDLFLSNQFVHCPKKGKTKNLVQVSEVDLYPTIVENGESTLINRTDIDLNVTVYDVGGRLIVEFPATAGSEETVKLDGVKKGVYLIRVNGEEYSETKRLIVR